MAVVATSCTHDEQPLNLQFFMSEPITGEIVRDQQRIKCTDVAFKNFVCMTDHQLEKLHSRCVDRKKAWWELWR